MRSNSILTLTTLASAASAASITVKVGSGGLVYTPASATAAVGDTVVFEFDSSTHSVTEGSFSDPCNPLTKGFNTGIINTAGTTFSITVTTTDPIYYYCAQVGHCQAGMVGVINPPSSGGTLAAFKSAAAASNANGSPPSEVFGGVISAPGGTPSTAPGVPAASQTSAAVTDSSPTTTEASSEAPTTTDASNSTAESTTAETTAAESTTAESTTAESTTAESTTVATTEAASATESTLSTAISTGSGGSGVYPSSNSSATSVPPPVETGSGAGAIFVPGGLISAAAFFLGAAVLFL